MGTHETGEGVKRNIFPFLRASQLVSVQSNRKANIVYPRNACVRVAPIKRTGQGQVWEGGKGGSRTNEDGLRSVVVRPRHDRDEVEHA